MRLYKKYGVFLFWVILLLDLLLLAEGFIDYTQYTTIGASLCLMSIFWANTRKSKHYTKKLLVYLMLIMFGFASFFVYKFQEHITLYYIFQAIALVSLSFLFSQMQPLSFKEMSWAFLGFVLSAIACFVSYKIIKFGYSGNLPFMFFGVMFLLCVTSFFGFNIYINKKKNKLAVNGFIPGVILLLVSFLVLQGYRFVLYGSDTKMMLTVVVLCNGFGLVLIVQNLVKYLKG